MNHNGMGSILIVEDKASMRQMLVLALESAGYRTVQAKDGSDALEFLKRDAFDLVLSDLKMPRMDGMALLKATRALPNAPAFIMLTAHGSIPDAVSAMNLGALDFIEKPFELEELEYKVAQAIGSHAAPGGAALDGVIGSAPAWLEAVSVVVRVIDSSLPLLLVGEAGVGKRLLGRRLHEEGPRAAHPLTVLDCAAGLDVERRLFGWEKGAFAGAARAQAGALELCAKGTVYLDQCHALSRSAQARLVRAMQDKRATREGGSVTYETSARIIAATPQDLRSMANKDDFREDLYYRLAAVVTHVPPLREREGDIGPLIEHILFRETKAAGRKLHLSPRAEKLLRAYAWPGNVAQLEVVIARCVSIAEGDTIVETDLPEDVRRGVEAGTGAGLIMDIESIERERLLQALTVHNWNQTHAAHFLRIGRTALQYKMNKYGLKKR